MENSLYIGLSRQLALQTRMTLVANNIANMNTPGYRGQHALFEEVLSDPRGEKFAYSQVNTRGQYDVTREGPVRETGNPLDVALVGPGFMGVTTPDGIKYTRAGNMTMNAQGMLVTSAGYPVAGLGGNIIIPPGTRQINIAERGTVSTENGPIGQLQLVEFANPQDLAPEGNGLYGATADAQPATRTKVIQGSVEGSNVQPVVEMTRMIEISREYESMQKMIQQKHDQQREAVQRLLQTNS